jgi:hypothetical protein
MAWEACRRCSPEVAPPSFRGARSANLRCAIAHRGILGFRVRCCASPRNDGRGRLARFIAPHPALSSSGLTGRSSTPRPLGFIAGVSQAVIASEAKQSIAARNRKLDCFVASLLAMTPDAPSHSRGVLRPGLAHIPPSENQRAQGRPGARCTRGLVCQWQTKNAHEHTGSAEASGLPCAMVYGL